jgi:inosine-uridine nucleoside N-ribohydrolase
MPFTQPTYTVQQLPPAHDNRLTWSGESGLDGVTLLPQPIEPAATDVDYLEAMYNALIATPPNSAWLVSTGTLTNIGLLFQKYTDLAGHLKGLSIMGGAVGGGFTKAPMGKVKGEGERFGNWTAYAEFNVSCNPLMTEQYANRRADLREFLCVSNSASRLTTIVRPRGIKLHLLAPGAQIQNNIDHA